MNSMRQTVTTGSGRGDFLLDMRIAGRLTGLCMKTIILKWILHVDLVIFPVRVLTVRFGTMRFIPPRKVAFLSRIQRRRSR